MNSPLPNNPPMRQPGHIGSWLFFSICLLGAFLFWLAALGETSGEQSRITASIYDLRTVRDARQQERMEWENKVRRLSDNWLDHELLDERARRNLMWIHPDDRLLSPLQMPPPE